MAHQRKNSELWLRFVSARRMWHISSVNPSHRWGQFDMNPASYEGIYLPVMWIVSVLHSRNRRIGRCFPFILHLLCALIYYSECLCSFMIIQFQNSQMFPEGIGFVPFRRFMRLCIWRFFAKVLTFPVNFQNHASDVILCLPNHNYHAPSLCPPAGIGQWPQISSDLKGQLPPGVCWQSALVHN